MLRIVIFLASCAILIPFYKWSTSHYRTKSYDRVDRVCEENGDTLFLTEHYGLNDRLLLPKLVTLKITRVYHNREKITLPRPLGAYRLLTP